MKVDHRRRVVTADFRFFSYVTVDLHLLSSFTGLSHSILESEYSDEELEAADDFDRSKIADNTPITSISDSDKDDDDELENRQRYARMC